MESVRSHPLCVHRTFLCTRPCLDPLNAPSHLILINTLDVYAGAVVIRGPLYGEKTKPAEPKELTRVES